MFDKPNNIFSSYPIPDGPRALHAPGASVRPRPDGRAPAAEQPADRLHHLPTAETGRRHCEHCRPGQFAGGLRRTHLPVVRVCQREPGAYRTGPDAPGGQHSVPADCDCHRVGKRR